MDRTDKENNVDFTTHAEDRRRNFISGTGAAVAAATTFVVVKFYTLRDSLRTYVHERLHSRDYTNGNLDRVLKEMAAGKSDTYTGAPIRPKTIRAFAEGYLNGEIDSMPGTLVGDRAFNAGAGEMTRKNPPFLEKAKKAFLDRLDELKKVYDERVEVLKKKYYNEGLKPQCDAIVDAVDSAFKLSQDHEMKHAAAEAIGAGNVFKGKAADFFARRKEATTPELQEALAQEFFGDRKHAAAMLRVLDEVHSEARELHSRKLRHSLRVRNDAFTQIREQHFKDSEVLAKHLFKLPEEQWGAKIGVPLSAGARDALRKIRDDFNTIDAVHNAELAKADAVRDAAYDALTNGNLFKENVTSFFEKKGKEDSNFIHFTMQAKKKLFDTPVYDYLAKELGLSFRHAHNKEWIGTMSAGGAVLAGGAVYKLSEAYQSRNDRKPKEPQSFQEAIQQKRSQQAAPTTPAL